MTLINQKFIMDIQEKSLQDMIFTNEVTYYWVLN
jgi:hypothetical protein